MITKEQRGLCAAITRHARENNPDLDLHTAALIRVLGSVIEGVDPIRAMGAPGEWGYGTPIGDALLALLQTPAPTNLPGHLQANLDCLCEFLATTAFGDTCDKLAAEHEWKKERYHAGRSEAFMEILNKVRDLFRVPNKPSSTDH